MNIFNLKRQIAGHMLMCGGGSSGGGNSGGDSGVGDGGKYSANGGGSGTFTDETGQTYQFNGGNTPYGDDASGTQAASQIESGYQSNGGQPMYGAEAPSMQAESAPAQTGISAGGDYSGYTTGSDENNNATPQYAKDMTDSEKMAQSILKKVPVLGPLYSGVEFAGKFIQPGGSLMRRGESGMASAHGFKDDAIDEDGNPIQKPDKKGLISKAIGSASDSFAQQVNQQAKQPSQQSNQNDAAPQAVTPAYAGGSVDASMYGSGSGWGSSIAKFAKAKQGGKL